MRVKKIFVKSFFALIFIFLLPDISNAYQVNTHIKLTKEIADLYNAIYDPDLTEEQMQLLMRGSSDEDIAPRWINHFYDPINETGWLGKRLQGVPEEKVMKLARLLFGKDPVSALNWAHNQNLQTESYQLYGGNRAFEAAVLFYYEGNKNKAYESLGHVLHLVEDMAVPAHTRQDSHFDMPVPEMFEKMLGVSFDNGEPYENWAEKYTAENPGLNIADKLKNNFTPVCDTLDECLISLAKYSNNNFFSQDSILDKDYNLPKVNYYKIEKIEDKDSIITYFSENNLLLARAKVDNNYRETKEQSLKYSDIHQSYWNNLSEQAVLAGGEVVRYFHGQAEKVKNKEIVVEKPAKPNLLALANSVSVYGEMERTGRMMGLAWNDFQAKLNEAKKELVSSVQDFYNRLTNFNPVAEFEPPTFSVEDTIFSEETVFSEPIPDFLPQDADEQNIELVSNEMIRQAAKDIGAPVMELVSQFGWQEDFDDILEKIDIIRSEIEKLRKKEDADAGNNRSLADSRQESESKNSGGNEGILPAQPLLSETLASGGTYGSPSVPMPVSYLKILISEIQISGLADEKEEFVELFNQNNEEINLTGWYLQRKTETGANYSTYASSNLFSGKIIAAGGYFLIARQGSAFESLADVITENSLGDTDSSSSLVFKNPKREISDKLGFGAPQDYEGSPAQNTEKGKTLGRKWVLSAEQDSDNNSADFEIQNPTPGARNIVYVAPAAPLVPPETLADTTAPQASFNLDPIQTALDFTIDFTITDPVGAASPSGIDSYIFRRRDGTGVWQEDIRKEVVGSPTSHNSEREFTGEDEKSYYFQAKVKDIAGNESDWLPEIPVETKIIIPKKVLINEIQISGLTDEKEEFVELYNPGSSDIDLTGWYLQRKTKTGANYSSFVSSSLFSGKKIKSKGYFLIGREESLFEALADIITSNTLGDFSDGGGSSLVIKNPDREIIDKAGWGQASDFETAPAQNPPKGQSIQRKWNSADLKHQDADDNSADFEILDPNPKTSYPKISIEDATNYPDDMGSGLPGSISYFLKIKWRGASSGIDYFDAQYKKNNGSWQDWILKTTETEKVLQAPYSLLADNIYNFRARATDQDGNAGDWKEIEINLANPVVINEIAYRGTNSSRDDLWLELYNKGGSPVDLTGWKIVSGFSGQDSLNIELEGTIPAKGYFILEKDGNAILDVAANQLFSGDFGKAYLYLYGKNNRYIDQGYIPAGGWNQGDVLREGNYYSVERISPYSFGIDQKNWRINNGTTITGKDRDNGQIFGTPAAINSVYQIYTSHYLGFTENTVLKKELSPYLFWGPSVSVLNNSTLTIEPGTVIKFLDAGLTIDGGLNAVGTADEKIIFTSFLDDADGRDTNGDAGGSLPNPGNWSGIYFTKNSFNSELENVVVRYAGGNDGDFGAGIKADRSVISLKNSALEKNKNKALWLKNSLSLIEGTQFIENNTASHPLLKAAAIQIEGSRPEIKNCDFGQNTIGINIEYWNDEENGLKIKAFPAIENNIFKDNFAAVWIGALSYPYFATNQMSNNSLNAPVLEGPVEEDFTLGSGSVYIIKTNLVIPAGKTLTMEPGAIIKFINAGLTVDGALKAIGSATQKIIFTSYTDDEYGGDTNIDGNFSSPVPGQWYGIEFTKNSFNSELENVVVQYAGAESGNNFGAGLRVDQSNISLKNSVIQNNRNNGLLLINSSSVVDSVQFSGHKIPDFPKESRAVFIQGEKPEIKNSSFQDNYYGIYLNKWTDIDTGLDIYPEAELHLIEPDFQANTFTGSLKLDIFDASIIP